MQLDARIEGTSVHDLGDSFVIAFRVGYWLPPPESTVAAFKRVEAIIANIEPSDLVSIGEWGTTIKFYDMNSKIVNPEITDAMRQNFIDQVIIAYPGFTYLNAWDNSQHGLSGFSVKIQPKKEKEA